jgi:hypothetical protein
MINQENFENIDEVEIINDDFSPLDAPVKQRSYTQHKLGDLEEMGELEEPTFERPSFAELEGESEEATAEAERPFNESYSQLDGKEKTMGAEMMAEMTLDIYEKGCFYMGKIPEISETKIDKLISEGEIDPSIQLQTEAGAMPIKEFAVEFNDSIKEAFVVTDEFKEKVKAPLIRVFKKRGVGMTDEQLLMYYFGTDIATKGAQAFMLRKTTNSILDSLRENTLAMREQQMANAPKPTKTEPFRDNFSNPTNTNTQTAESEDVHFTENIAEVVAEPIGRTPRQRERSIPKTNLDEQLVYFEPEEQGVYSNLKDNGGFTEDFQDVAGMPKFGDPEILSELERLSGNEPKKPVRKARTTAVKKPRGTAVRNPRTKK